jgi:hypothetical protein
MIAGEKISTESNTPHSSHNCLNQHKQCLYFYLEFHKMASAEPLNDSVPNALPMLDHPTLPSPKQAQSVPDSHRRHSLPLHFLPPGLWSANTSSASLVESEEAARGEHILDEATVAHRISALRQLNGATRSRHRYAKSTGARSSTFNQPVIVRTYSGRPGRVLNSETLSQ